MPFFAIERTDNYQLGIWKAEESLEELLALIPDSLVSVEDLKRFSTDNRKKEWLAVRVLLYHLLEKPYQIAYYSTGRPFLVGTSSYISISHTKGYVAVIVSSEKAVGVDIEYYSSRVQRIASRFMNDREKISSFYGDDIWSLLLHWSAKETVFKIMAQQQVDFREQLRVEPFQVEKTGSFIVREFRSGMNIRYTIRYKVYPEFVLTWSIED